MYIVRLRVAKALDGMEDFRAKICFRSCRFHRVPSSDQFTYVHENVFGIIFFEVLFQNPLNRKSKKVSKINQKNFSVCNKL